MARKAFWVSALACALGLVAASPGLAGGTLVQVSSTTSPYAACAASDSSQPGHNSLNGKAEPQLAVDSRNGNMIAMWHQDRWTNGGAHGIGTAYFNSGSNSWTQNPIPWSICSGATAASGLNIYFRNSDPWVSFGPDGTAYASALAFNIVSPNNANSVAVATSSTDGATWSNVGTIPGSVFSVTSMSTDKNSTTADPVRAGVAYTVWDTLLLPTDNPDDNPRTSSYTGPAYFSKTTDGGKTWSQAQIIVNTVQRQQTIGNVIVVDPRTHVLYDFFNDIIAPNTPRRGAQSNAQLAFVKSSDGGTSWTEPQLIAPFNSLGVFDPNTGQPLRTGNGLESVAIDPATGSLYVVWQSASNFLKNVKQGSGFWDDQILITSSTNGGATWSSPSVVHQLPNGMPTYTPIVAVNRGRVAVTYYDNRNLKPGQTNALPTDYFVSISTGGGAWHEQQLTSTSFDESAAPLSRGFFLGDYEGLQPSGAGFQALFVKTNCNATDSTATTFTGDCGPANSSTNPDPSDAFTIAIA
jgi:hypothetical protein